MTRFIGSFPCIRCQAEGKHTRVKVYDRLPEAVMCMKCRRKTDRVDNAVQEPVETETEEP